MFLGAVFHLQQKLYYAWQLVQLKLQNQSIFMNFNKNTIFVLLLSLLCTISLSTPSLRRRLQAQTWQQVMALIDAKIAEKKIASQERSTIMSSISTAEEEAKKLRGDLLLAKIAAVSAYRSFFEYKVQCDGFSASSEMIGVKSQISSQVCLEDPISLQASGLFTLKTQLEGYQADNKITQKSYQLQSDFVSDTEAELNIYKNLEAFFKSKGYIDYENKYSNQLFQFNNFYLMQKMGADLKKQSNDAAKSTVNLTKQAIQRFKTELNPRKSLCQQNLPQLKKTLNTKLSDAARIQGQINEKQNWIVSGWKDSEAKLKQLKMKTGQLKELVDKWALLTATPTLV